MSKCEICGVAADLKCGGCKSVFYCGKDHQKKHWKNGHKLQCRCFEVCYINAVICELFYY